MQLPHCEQFSQPPYVPITLFAPRPPASMASSPIHSSQTRVHRLQRMQRCGSLATIGERYFSGRAFLRSVKRSSRPPQSNAISCSSHSPPRSQTGQSSGWFASRNSIIARCAFSISSLSVVTTMPSVQRIVQEVCSLGIFSMRTRHMRQEACNARSA